MKEMTDEEVNAKHLRVRGSDRYKYPPNESRCKAECGIEGHCVDTHRFTGKTRIVQHRCFLALGHGGFCEFSSECGVTDRAIQRDEMAA